MSIIPKTLQSLEIRDAETYRNLTLVPLTSSDIRGPQYVNRAQYSRGRAAKAAQVSMSPATLSSNSPPNW